MKKKQKNLKAQNQKSGAVLSDVDAIVRMREEWIRTILIEEKRIIKTPGYSDVYRAGIIRGLCSARKLIGGW